MDTGVDGMALSSVSNPKAASKKSTDFGSDPMGAIAGGYDDRLDEVIVSLVSPTTRALGV